MAAPTNPALVKKTLANAEPSTHGPSRYLARCSDMSEVEGKAAVTRTFGDVAV
jgi:hypothetical protein